MKLNELLAVSDSVESTRRIAPLRELTFTQLEGAIGVKHGQEDIGKLSKRALGNLTRLVGASPKLLLNQAQPVLNEVIRAQLPKVENISLLLHPSEANSVVSIFTDKQNLVGYSELLDWVENKDIEVYGNPIADDSVTLKINNKDDFKINEESYILQSVFRVSHNGMVPSLFNNGIYRLICSNGAVDLKYAGASLKTADSVTARAIARQYVEDAPKFGERVKTAIEFAHRTTFEPNMHMSVMRGIPMSVRKVLDEAIVNPAVHVKAFDDGKADIRLKRVIDVFNLVTGLAKRQVYPVNTKVEAAAFEWIETLRNICGAN